MLQGFHKSKIAVTITKNLKNYYLKTEVIKHSKNNNRSHPVQFDVLLISHVKDACAEVRRTLCDSYHWFFVKYQLSLYQ